VCFFLQQLDESIKETLHTVNKHLIDETTSVRTASPEPSMTDNIQSKSNYIQLTIHTTYLNKNFIKLLMIFQNILENVQKQLMFYFHQLIIK